MVNVASGRRYLYSPVHTQRCCGCAGYGGADDAYVYVMRVCICVYDAWRTYAYVMRGMMRRDGCVRMMRRMRRGVRMLRRITEGASNTYGVASTPTVMEISSSRR